MVVWILILISVFTISFLLNFTVDGEDNQSLERVSNYISKHLEVHKKIKKLINKFQVLPILVKKDVSCQFKTK